MKNIMCGIAGIVDFKRPVEPESLKAMCAIMRHRGPDHQGIWRDDCAGLGHNRLSIIDPSGAGDQPMTNEDGTFCITYNGEIYNYRELHGRLKERHFFKSATDTEVLLHLWEESQAGLLPELNGIFAFAVWNTKDRCLTLARDPLGVKPVYYWCREGRFVFASEIKALLAAGVPRRLNREAVAEHFTFENTTGDKTLFEDIFILPAGVYARFDETGLKTIRYYQVRFDETPAAGTIEDHARRIQLTLESSVKRQLMSDVPLGTYLSGGMDTGSIAALAVLHLPGMHSFTCGFGPCDGSPEEKAFDERAYAGAIAGHLKTTHHELVLDCEAMERNVVRAVWHLDEPRMGISYQILCVAALAGRHVKVVLSGAGGDELFAGYPWRYRWTGQGVGPEGERAGYQAAVRFFNDRERPALFTDSFNKLSGGYSSFDAYRKEMKDCDAHLPLNRALFWDLKTFLHGILVVEDKLNMAHSVEARVPLLDKELVSLALRTPAGFKLNGDTGKVVLRKAMEGLLPAQILNNRKQGFTPPDKYWYRTHTMPYIRSVLFSKEARRRELFNEQTLRSIVEEHAGGTKDHRFLLWSLVCFEWWQRLFFDKFCSTAPS